MSNKKISNAIIIGPSSSGKTTLAKYFAEKYNGQCISLDGITASGRPINSILPMSNTKKFTKEDIGVLIRRIMIREAKEAMKHGIVWFIDDIDNYVIKLLPKSMKQSTKIICIIPTLTKLVQNVITRNREASFASEERHVITVMKQLRNFVTVKHCHDKCDMIEMKKYPELVISNIDIVKACENDKIFYSAYDRHAWQDETNGILHLYGFKPMKSKKIVYAILKPIDLGQHLTIINSDDFDYMINKITQIL